MKQFCKRGHARTQENVNKRGECKKCILEADKKWLQLPINKEKMIKLKRKWNKKSILTLNDCYIKNKLKKRNIVTITPEIIELKRQQIIMKRTLNEFKKWRKENESDYTDVYGKQQSHEENYEGRI
jgi:hypothetical protein